VAVERTDTSDEDAEKVAGRQDVARRMPADQPGTEPPGLSRADSRAAAESTNEKAPRSAWHAPEIHDHAERPEADEIRFTDDQRAHVLDGDKRGGGHRHGAGRPGKTEFPADWDDDRTVAHVIDVARNPDTAEFQRRGTWRVQGERDGVEIIVAIKPDGRIWTAFPSPGGRGVIENPRDD
jgi:hypothetical protein